MMKKLIPMAAALVLAVSSVAMATEYTITIPVPIESGMQLVSPPQVPLNSDPLEVFKTPTGDIDINGMLYGFDNVGKGYNTYLIFNPSGMGGILLGDAYWLDNQSGSQITWTYEAAPNGLKTSALGDTMVDMWISLPKQGMSLFGLPFNSQIDITTCFLTDGTSMLSMADAAAEDKQWTDGNIYAWVNGGYETRGIYPWQSPILDPWTGYWIQTNVDNLALIIPAPATN